MDIPTHVYMHIANAFILKHYTDNFNIMLYASKNNRECTNVDC